MSNPVCQVCPRHCVIPEGNLGFCRARRTVNGQIIDDNYGKITAAALDPIEKKPLAQFMPGSMILSLGSYGCNLRCSFCQNHTISMPNMSDLTVDDTTPEFVLEKAKEFIPYGNIGVAYTYNEPLIGFEFVRDCAKLVHEAGMKNVVVTNGYTDMSTLEAILPYIDAFNIDLKSFNEHFYKEVGGNLEDVKKIIERASKDSHVEVTTLVIPGENDSEKEMKALAQFLHSVNPDIVLHITRFFPCYKMTDKEPTPVQTIYKLVDVAKQYLKNVYPGNV